MPSKALSGRLASGRGREGFGEVSSPFKQEKDPLIKRETLELVRAYNKIEEERVRWLTQAELGTAKRQGGGRLVPLPFTTFGELAAIDLKATVYCSRCYEHPALIQLPTLRDRCFATTRFC